MIICCSRVVVRGSGRRGRLCVGVIRGEGSATSSVWRTRWRRRVCSMGLGSYVHSACPLARGPANRLYRTSITTSHTCIPTPTSGSPVRFHPPLLPLTNPSRTQATPWAVPSPPSSAQHSASQSSPSKPQATASPPAASTSPPTPTWTTSPTSVTTQILSQWAPVPA